MKRRIAIAIGLLAGLGHEASAQKDSSTAVRPASSGVYTAAQAKIGEEAYAGMCTGCHTPASHMGSAFASAWSGRPVSELYGFIRAAMPKNEPGSLTADEYAAIVAYLLKLNGLPAGRQALPADSAALDRIRIDLGKGS
jgi:mono/diheme cytochrome c family protein